MATTMSSEVTIQFLDAFGDAWNRHDVDSIMTFMADDCAFETTAGPEVCGKRYEGREAVRTAFARVFSIFADAHFGNPRHFLTGDRGCTEWTFTGTGADGKRVEVLGCDLFTFRDGRIALKSSYFKNRLG
jgi:taurine dehydrogenase small subunit